MPNNRTNTTSHNTASDSNVIAYMVLALLAALTVYAIWFAFTIFSYYGLHDEPKYEGIESRVTWQMVNLREGHNTEEPVIEELYYGEKVILTSQLFEGKEYEWIYVHSEKGDGWVATVGLQEPAV